MSMKYGFSGSIAHFFMRSQLTPLLALFGLVLGLFAAMITPREEEPQINVTMANIFVPFPGASVKDVEKLVATPLEKILGGIRNVEHIYSVSSPGMATLTVQFEVGIERTEALVRLYSEVYSNPDWRPQGLGVGQPIVKPKGIDDVPVIALTLHSADSSNGAFELKQIANSLETELKRIPGTLDVETIGGPDKVLRVQIDAQKMAVMGLSLDELRQGLLASNLVMQSGALIADNQYQPVTSGSYFASEEDLSELVVGVLEGKPVYLEDVADLIYGAEENEMYVWYQDKNAAQSLPAVTITVSKKSGENAVDIANAVIQQIEAMKGYILPDDIDVTITRNYGETANNKANKLIQELIFATISVIALVLVTLGKREAFVVGSAVILTLMITLFASWAWGFTLNRVSLFALIFSIGILVDDAIVVVENIHRHLAMGRTSLLEAIPVAVQEVGGPTILATFAIIAALLPMAFVSGLMGPYMSPIPINASMGMLLSLIIAFTFTPWLSAKVFKGTQTTASAQEKVSGRLHRFFSRLMHPFLGAEKRRNRYLLGFSLIGLIAGAIGLAVVQLVVLKMLPFDNKSEFQLIVDMPEGTPVENTNAVLVKLSEYLLSVDEVMNVQGYSGTTSPVGFNGLVRQYYLRALPHQGDLQVNLRPKSERDLSSHEIALSVRSELEKIAKQEGASLKIIEVPPGPPVMSPLVAEVYGPDYEGQMEQAKALVNALSEAESVVDLDTSIESDASRIRVLVNRVKAAQLGISQAQVTSTIATLLGGEDVTYLQTGHTQYPIPVRLSFSEADKARLDSILDTKLKSRNGHMVPLSEVVSIETLPWEKSIYRKNHLPVVYVTADVAGGLDSPLYAMFETSAALGDLEQNFISQPLHNQDYSIKWDGEWQITYETFRDMGAAYSVGLVLIYFLVVAQFGSYLVPLIIMAPIPLTMIGIMPGHALLGAQFTATSMIGMIALAGIIVRNSILLVDFINHQVAAGAPLEQAVVDAASVRAKPIFLTAISAMVGAAFILADPIFNGLAVSLIFGLIISTVLTLLVIPVLYYSRLRRQAMKSKQ